MKNFISIRSMQGAMLLTCTLGTCALAQPQPQTHQSSVELQTQWEKLQKANSRITASDVVWKRVQRIRPIAAADPDKWAARALQEARQRGMTEEQSQQVSDSERREAVLSKQGRVINSTIRFVRVGTSVLAHIEYSDASYRSHVVEFSDGTNSLFAQTQEKGQKVSADGTVLRIPQETLKFSAGGYQVARFLTGIPLDQNFSTANPMFSSDNSSLSVLPNENIVVERKAQIEAQEWQEFVDVTFAKNGLYPLSLDTFSFGLIINGKTTTLKKDKKALNLTLGGYKQYQGDIWFPSKIVVTMPVGTTEYSLVEAKFNDQVDPADLRLPPKLRVADFRFGDSKMVNYTVKDGKLPSDEEVKALLQMDKQTTQAKKEVSKETTTNTKLSASPFGSVAGLGFIALGGLILLKGRRKDS